MLRGHRQSDGLMSDYYGGNDFQTHHLFSTQPCSIQLMMYYNKLEVCNPLESKSKIHKIGMFHFQRFYLLGATSNS